MLSHLKGFVLLLLPVFLTIHLRQTHAHSLLQSNTPRSGYDCGLTPRELRRYSRGEGRWLVTDGGLEALDGDIQRLVNCTEEGDVLLLDVEAPVQPPRRITIPWNLTLTSFVDDSRVGDGTVPEAARKVTVLCPREDEGVFLVEANETLFANFVFRNCSLSYRSGEVAYGIITTASCSGSHSSGTIRLQHIDFEANFLNMSAALYVQEPSCSGIQIVDFRFQNNSCIGTCAASLPSPSEIQNVRLTTNRFFEVAIGNPVLFGIRPGSNTTVEGLTASGNNGTVVQVQHANLTISNSHFFQNSGGSTRGEYYSGGVTLLHSYGQILDCRFEENTWSNGSSIVVHNSSSVIGRTSVIGSSTYLGGGVSLTSCSTISIVDSVIANNSAALNGGGVYSNGTRNLQIENTTIEMNSARTGGALYFAYGDLEITSSFFRSNTVSREGAGLYFFRGALTTNDSNLIDNRADGSGGGGCIREGVFSLTNSTLVQNGAATGGGLDIRVSSGSLNNSYFAMNSVGSHGGGLYMGTSNAPVVHNCTFVNNRASHGGAIYGNQVMRASVLSSRFVQNRASDSGGGAHIHGGTCVMEGNTFEENASTHGGAIRSDTSSNLTIEDCSFTSNSAGYFGGSILAFSGAVTLATNLQFQNNTGLYGGAFASVGSTTEISASSFVSNTASAHGGAVSSERSDNLTVEDCIFASNSANGYGGAIRVIESSVSGTNLRFRNNRATSLGGAVNLHVNVSAWFSHSVFFNESSGIRGGALSVLRTVLVLHNISIGSCFSGNGGGFDLYASSANISETSVTLCEASESGGGIYIFGSEATGHGLNISSNRAVGTVLHTARGGGIAMERSSTLSVRSATIAGNRAHFGAGLYGQGECTVLVSDSRLYNNSASMNGGAAYIHDSSLTLRSVSCVRNSAVYGGSVYVFNSSLTLNDSQLINSSSTDSGGSVMADEEATVVMEGTRILSSGAVNGGGIMLARSYFSGIRVQFQNCSARMHGGGVWLNESSSFLCTGCLFENNSALHEGGAIRMTPSERQLLAFQLANTVFRGNAAMFGGGVHFQTEDESGSCSSVNSTECTFLALVGCVFTNNHASFAGGAILANNPIAIRISCHPFNMSDPSTYYTMEEFGSLRELSSLDVACSNWMENSASTYGPIVASYARRLSSAVLLGPNKTEEIEGNRHVVRNHQSGLPLPIILLEAIDEFNQGPALIQGNQMIEAFMRSPDGFFAGTFVVEMEDSRGNFSGITGYTEPGNYNIHIDFNTGGMPRLIIVVEIRDCLIRERQSANGTLCEPCSADSYNFHPLSQEDCTRCPDEAKCDSVAIRPKKGFWHQAPCSNHVQRCLSEIACDAEDRDSKLKELGSTIEDCDFDNEFMYNYTEALCREGYTGPLCGSCNTSHGRTRSFRCEECYGRFISLLLVILVALVLLGLAAFTIRGSLSTHGHPVHRSQSRSDESSSSPPVNLQMAEMLCTGTVPPELIYPHLRTQEINTSTPAAQQQGQGNPELAKWKAVEIFKITINYLQVIAIAISVNVAWTSALIGLFETAEFIGVVTSEAAGRSTDCVISADSSIPRSAVRTIVNLIIPIVAVACFAAFWTVDTIKNQRGSGYLLKRCLLSALVVSYLSYITITKTSVNILYCVEVFDSAVLEDDSTTNYWAVDTALKCYNGSHTVLASVFGWPVLILFSLGFPVVVAYVLITKRSHEGIQSPWLFETAGFLYRSYDKRFIFWESVILLRKATLAVIVVFAYPLGGNLQGLLAVCVLMIAAYMQALCSPYRSEFDALNRLEGLSLLISSLTFVSGLFFNDDRTSAEARAAITAFLILANVGLFSFFAIRFFVASATYLGIVLDNEGVPFDRNGTAFHIVKTFMKNRIEVHLGSALKHFGVFAYGRHEESFPHEVSV